MTITSFGNQPSRAPLACARLISMIVWALCMSSARAFITVGPVADTACQYHDIAAAVQAAGQVSGPELIAISGGPWTGQTTITDHDPDGLTIEGGFANCSAGVSTGRTTVDGQPSKAASPIAAPAFPLAAPLWTDKVRFLPARFSCTAAMAH